MIIVQMAQCGAACLCTPELALGWVPVNLYTKRCEMDNLKVRTIIVSTVRLSLPFITHGRVSVSFNSWDSLHIHVHIDGV